MSNIDRMDSGHPVIIRNSRSMVGLFLVLACGAFFIGVCFVILALAGLEHFVPNHLVAMAVELASGVVFMAMAVQVWSMALMRLRNTVRLTAEGVYFQFGSPKKNKEIYLSWSKIEQVTHRRLANSHSYVVGGADLRVTFSSSSFGRPKHIATLIASRAGRTMTEAK